MVVILSFALWHCVLVITMSLHVYKFGPGAHVIYGFEFALKFGCDKVVSEPC
jgi:hypothetical protein